MPFVNIAHSAYLTLPLETSSFQIGSNEESHPLKCSVKEIKLPDMFVMMPCGCADNFKNMLLQTVANVSCVGQCYEY
jgi:hypothetical protein